MIACVQYVCVYVHTYVRMCVLCVLVWVHVLYYLYHTYVLLGVGAYVRTYVYV